MQSLKLTWRQLWRNRTYSAINILGLSLGLTAALLVLTYIVHETSYDSHHDSADRIFRLVWESDFGVSSSPPEIPVEKVTEELSGIAAASVLTHSRYTALRTESTSTGPVTPAFVEEAFYYADPSVFDIFSLSLIEGDPATALNSPGSLVISDDAADRYFGAIPALGRQLVDQNGETFTVTGVLPPAAGPSHLNFDFLAPRSHLPEGSPWQRLGPTYVLLEPGAAGEDVQQLIDTAFTEAFLGWGIRNMAFHLEPVESVHLRSRSMGEGSEQARRGLLVFGAIALFLLLTACMNYVNLATARGLTRGREVGIRKAVGAGGAHLARQFMFEPALLLTLAAALSIILFVLFLPWFATLTGRSLAASQLLNPRVAGFFLGIVLVTGILAGLYPVLRLTRLRAAHVLKGEGFGGSRGGGLRRALVVAQFTLSAAVIIGTFGIQRQLEYLHTRSPGYEVSELVSIRLRGDISRQWEGFKQDVLRLSGVEAASGGTGTPVEAMITMQRNEEGDEPFRLYHFGGDENYLATLGMEVVAGDGLRHAVSPPGSDSGYVAVNEAAVRMLDLGPDPIGKIVGNDRVSAVVRDFHVQGFREAVGPAIISSDREIYPFLLVRMSPGNIAGTLAAIGEVWNARAPGYPFEYVFQEDKLRAQYDEEQKLAAFFQVFSVLVILIAALGLFGLAAFTAQRRTREMGIRKVLGATATQIVVLLSRDITIPVVLALALAVPLAWLGTDAWLSEYAYRVQLTAWPFVVTALLVVATAWITVAARAISAAKTNPVDTIRD